MTKKNDLFSELISKSIVQLVKKESNVTVKEIIEDIEDPDDEVDVDTDKLPATAASYTMQKNSKKKYKSGLKKQQMEKEELSKDKKKYKGGLKQFQDFKKKKK